MLGRCLATLLAVVILAGCSKNAVELGDEALKAISTGRQLARSNELGKAEDALRTASKAVEDARAAAARTSAAEDQRAVRTAEAQLSDFRTRLERIRVASDAAAAADASTAAAGDELAGTDELLQDAIKGVAKKVTCKVMDVRLSENRNVTWDELRSFITEAATGAVPQPKAVELRERAEKFDQLQVQVDQQRQQRGVDLKTFRDNFCGVVAG
jgi:hypothetical protein